MGGLVFYCSGITQCEASLCTINKKKEKHIHFCCYPIIITTHDNKMDLTYYYPLLVVVVLYVFRYLSSYQERPISHH